VSIESDIIDEIVSRVSSTPGIKTVNFDRVRTTISEFEAHELPAVQIFDQAQVIEHERNRILVTWELALELIMKSDITGIVSQKDLLEKRREIQLKLWERPNIEIPGVVHLIYNGNVTDLHLLEPYYIARIDFSVLYYDHLTGSC
jgi:hypothetical protein